MLVKMVCIPALTLSFLCGFQLKGQHPSDLHVFIRPVFENTPVKFDHEWFVNESRDSIRFTLLKFYLGGICLSGKGKYCEKKSIHLIDFDEKDKFEFVLKGAAGDYEVMEFFIGTDSIMNVSGALEGDLDPGKGMYWAWNTGYINAKLEGNSPSCKTKDNAFEFHIGGFKYPYSTRKNCRIKIKSENHNVLELDADISAWFNGKNTVSLSKINHVVDPGENAKIVADNYSIMIRQKGSNRE